MLQLYDVNHNKIGGLINYKDFKIEREINQLDTLSFLYPVIDAKHDLILEECYIRITDNEYVVKEVNYSDENYDEYVCKVNTEDISSKDVSHFEAIEQTCTDSINLALSGTGWTIGNCDVTKKRTTRKNNCTAYDVLKEIQSAYGCEMTFDAVNKKVYIYHQMGSDKGAYFIEQLNLKKVNPQRNSYDYITRLIAIGKDGLDITSVNGGIKYVENYQYSSKVLTAFWEDNRYTVAQDLKDDAVERLDFLSKPYKTYSADVYDLANMSEDNKYSILDYSLGDTITLSSKTRNIKEKQRIVKLTEYPDEPEKNTVEIANKIASLDVLNVRFQDTSDTVDSVTTSAGEVDGTKVDGIDWTQVKNVSIYCADIQDLSTVTARIGTLEATTAHITNGIIDNATIDVAKVNNLSSTYATIQNLSAATANISTLQTDVASIKTVLAGNVGASNLQAGAIQAGSAVIANSAISSAQIISLDVAKVNAGIISTTKFTLQSDSGNMLMSDNTIQIKDANRTRVQIGKDANADYNMYVWDASGNLMFDAAGLKAEGIKDKIIRDDMVSDTANINGGKIEKESLITQINGATTNLKASKILLDTQAQTLDVAFTSLSQTVTSQGQTVTSQGTQITTLQGQISNKVWQTDISTSADQLQGQITTINNNYSSLNQTVSGISTNVSSLQTTTSSLGSRMTTAEANITANANQIATKVSQTQVDSSIASSKQIPDTRNDNQPPSWYWSNYPRQVANEFKIRSVIGAPGSAYYGNLTTIVQWSDSNGSPITQEFKSNDGLFRRYSTSDSAWSSWEQIENTAGSQAKVDYLNQNTVTPLANRMSAAESSITQQANQISAKVNTSDFGSLMEQNATAFKWCFNNVDSASMQFDANGLHVYKGSITGVTLTGVTIQTGTSGARIVETSNTLDTYNSNGQRVIELGGTSGSLAVYNASGYLIATIGGGRGDTGLEPAISSNYFIKGGTIVGDTIQTSDGEVQMCNYSGHDYITTPELDCDLIKGQSNIDVIKLGNQDAGKCRIDTTSGMMRLYVSDPTQADTGVRIRASGEVDFMYGSTANAYILGSGAIHGTSKSAITNTVDYGQVITYSDESPDHVFNDRGRGKLDSTGSCTIAIDSIFAETVNTKDGNYHVQLTGIKTANNIYVDDLQADYFVVKGEPGKEFFWMITAERYGYEGLRFNDADLDV